MHETARKKHKIQRQKETCQIHKALNWNTKIQKASCHYVWIALQYEHVPYWRAGDSENTWTSHTMLQDYHH